MNKFILICCLMFLLGCAHAIKKDKPKFSHGIPDVTGDCVDPVRIKAGGKLGILAFKAGPQAESNEQLDHFSSLLIKGIRENLEKKESVLVLTDDADSADLILEGYIEELYRPGRFSRLVLQKKKMRFSVSGEIWQKGKGTKILTFASTDTVKSGSRMDEEVYQMGQAIGQFIMDKVAAKE